MRIFVVIYVHCLLESCVCAVFRFEQLTCTETVFNVEEFELLFLVLKFVSLAIYKMNQNLVSQGFVSFLGRTIEILQFIF